MQSFKAPRLSVKNIHGSYQFQLNFTLKHRKFFSINYYHHNGNFQTHLKAYTAISVSIDGIEYIMSVLSCAGCKCETGCVWLMNLQFDWKYSILCIIKSLSVCAISIYYIENFAVICRHENFLRNFEEEWKQIFVCIVKVLNSPKSAFSCWKKLFFVREQFFLMSCY